MSTVRFTADLHLGHRLVSELRGFPTVDEHDTTILNNLSTDTRPGDTLWVLGDISVGGSTAQRNALEMLTELAHGRQLTLHLVAGNHDGAHPMHRNAHKWDHAYRQVFASVQPFARRRIDGTNVWLSHFPWLGGGDHTDDERCRVVRLNDDGSSWLMHGHTHSPERIEREQRQIHVGLDAWDLQPVTLSAVTELIAP